jgi:hypothetical protein
MGDIVMEGTQPSQTGAGQAMSQQSLQMSQPPSMAVSASNSAAASMNEMVNQPVFLDSRKSSAASVVMMQSQSMGVPVRMGMQQSQQIQASDLSSEVHEKLSLIDR